MNIRQAKERIRISDFLVRAGEKLGFNGQPAYTRNGEHWYHSMLPGRQDDTPSFKTDRTDRLWSDKGIGQGGTIIELTMKLFNCDESGALHALSSLYQGELFDTPATVQARRSAAKRQGQPEGMPLFEQGQQQEGASERTSVEITPITSRGLYWYLHYRGIDPGLAKRYVKEIRYKANGNPFYALAFASDAKDSYEMRNGVGVAEGGEGFKGVHGPKAITTLHPEKASEGGSVTVFEGFFDFLTALAYYGKVEPDTPVIVMNSTAMHAQTAEAIRRTGAARVFLYLDHDKTGKDVVQALRDALPDIEIVDKSGIYAGYPDFNDFWMKEGKQAKARIGKQVQLA